MLEGRKREERVGELGNMARLVCGRDKCQAELQKKINNLSCDLDDVMRCGLAAEQVPFNQQFNIISLVSVDSLLCFP